MILEPAEPLVTSPLLPEQVGDLPVFRFREFARLPGIVHAVLTRRGGISPPPFESLNLSFSVGDHPDHVRRNRRRVREALGLEEVISVGQVHGGNALVLTSREAPAGAAELQGIDILITNLPGLGLMIKQADCQAVLLYDPEHRAVANIHCGWRGNVQDVLGQAVRHLSRVCGSRPEALRAAISPSLGPCCAQFTNYRKELPEAFWTYQVRPEYFDLWRLSRDQLQAAGVRREHISIAGWCTRCREGDFFSYRRDRPTGRNATVIALSPTPSGPVASP